MNKVKQVIIVRKDLDMSIGKTAAQVAHASLKSLMNYGKWIDEYYEIDCHEEAICEWLEGPFTKICVKVNSEKELLEFQSLADSMFLNNALIKDSGLTELKEPAYTCLAIGPDYSDKIDKLTGKLPLL